MVEVRANRVRLTAQDIEIAVAAHFNFRVNLIVPNVWWGWSLRHEADLIILRPSGYCDEVEIKVTAADIRADAKKRHGHWDDRRIARVWFAVPHSLANSPDIPADAGVLSVTRSAWYRDAEGRWAWRPCRDTDTAWDDRVTVVRPARLRKKETRTVVSASQRQKLAELGAMRIWDLKSALANHNRKQVACRLIQ